jgi:hypothetical protein
VDLLLERIDCEQLIGDTEAAAQLAARHVVS